jgi:hypothetical protein
MSYGVNILVQQRQCGISLGDKAAGLPVARPARIAKVLGLEVPPVLLARTDEVIE